MSNIIENILQKDNKNKLKNYIYTPSIDLNEIPLGSHIKFIDRNENIKTGGFLIKYVVNDDITKCYFILKSNIIYKLYIYFYWIFYKEIIHESKFNKVIKPFKLLVNETNKQPINETNKSLKIINVPIKKDIINKKSNSKRNIFLNLLK
jgi:hypothetical protein